MSFLEKYINTQCVMYIYDSWKTKVYEWEICGHLRPKKKNFQFVLEWYVMILELGKFRGKGCDMYLCMMVGFLCYPRSSPPLYLETNGIWVIWNLPNNNLFSLSPAFILHATLLLSFHSFLLLPSHLPYKNWHLLLFSGEPLSSMLKSKDWR